MGLGLVDFGRSRDRGHHRGSGGVPAFSPLQLGSSLVAWYDATKQVTLNGSTVSSWADQSGNGHTESQGSAPLQPAYNTSGNFPVIRFNNAEWLSGSLGALVAPFGVYFTAKFSASANPGGGTDFDYLYSLGHGAAGNGGLIGLARWRPDGSGDDSKIYAAAYDTVPTVYYDGAGNNASWHVWSHTHLASGTKNNLRIDGTTTSITDYTNALSVGGLFTIGGYNTNGTPTVANFLSGDLFEIVVVSGTLTAAQQTTLERYMGNRVGVVTA